MKSFQHNPIPTDAARRTKSPASSGSALEGYHLSLSRKNDQPTRHRASGGQRNIGYRHSIPIGCPQPNGMLAKRATTGSRANQKAIRPISRYTKPFLGAKGLPTARNVDKTGQDGETATADSSPFATRQFYPQGSRSDSPGSPRKGQMRSAERQAALTSHIVFAPYPSTAWTKSSIIQ